MTDLAPLFAFPVVVWSGVVAVSLVYWLFVMAGVIHLGEGVDGGAEGAAEGTSGAVKGALESVGHGADVDVDVDGPDLDIDGDGAGHGVLGLFRMRNVPITVSGSILAFFSWIFSFGILFAAAKTGHALPSAAQLAITFLGAPLLALPLTKAVTLPLAPLLNTRRAKTAKDLVGVICTVRTGEANDRFGEATVPDTGAELVLRVRVEGGTMKRGEQAVILGWDAEREEYIVAPLEEPLRDAIK